MNDLIEEDEIKIEYNESYDIDPLNTRSQTIDDDDIQNDYSNNFVDNYEERDEEELSTNSLCFQDEAEKLNDLNPECINVTWYKQVDKTGRYSCKYCDRSYLTVQTIRNHVRAKHKEEARKLKVIVYKNVRKAIQKCHICHQKFVLISELQNHVNKNHNLESIKFSCCICNAVFKSIEDNNVHIQTKHNKSIDLSKIHICNVCGYRTVKKSHYNQHRMTHSKNKTKKCKFCDYATSHTTNLNVHERIHTNDKPYSCVYKDCNYTCSSHSALNSHKLQHDPEKNMLYCDKCSYKTVYKNSLQKHIGCHIRKILAA